MTASPDDVLRSTPEKDNFQRVTRLLITGGTNLLREVFDIKCPPGSLPTILNNPATKKLLKTAKLTKPQWKCLFPSKGVCGKSTDFDVTLLFRLLRTICHLTPPVTGWDSLPVPTDHSLTADLIRIKYYRNSVFAHVGQTMEITDDEFLSLWQEISGVLERIARQISTAKKTEWQKAIDSLLKDPLTADDERNVQELKRWYLNDMDVKKSIEDLKVSTQEVVAHVEDMETKFERRLSEIFELVETKIKEEAQDIKDQLEKIYESMECHSLGDIEGSTIKPRDDGTENEGKIKQPRISPPCKSPVDETDDANQYRRNAPYPSRRLAETMKREELKIKDYRDGTPSIYELPMTQELLLSKSMITKQSIGDPVLSQEKVLLMVGATGAGKSTLINGMVNHIMGVKWEDDFRFKVAMDDLTRNYVTAYTFNPMDGSTVPYTFTIIDTPGFGATEGVKRDKEISEQIKKFFSISPPEGIDHLDGIGFVVQASQTRHTPTQEYIFNLIFSIFGRDVSKNIFMMITFADSRRPPVLEAIKEAHIPSQSEHSQFFKFNNSALFAKNSAEEGELSFDELFWKMGFNSFSMFFVEFPESESVSLQLTKEVLEERKQLEMLLQGLNEQITFGINKIEEMRQEEIVLQQHEKDIEANKKFTYKVDVTKPHYVSLQGTEQHTTTCLPCNYTCHRNCKIPDDLRKNKCWAMGEDGRCRICPRKCIWSEHKNRPYLIEHREITETRTQEDLKKKYHEAVLEKATTKQMMTSLNESLLEVHFQVLTKIKQAQKSGRRLDEIALKPNPLSEIDYIELLIASERRSTSPGWKERITYYDVVKRHTIRLSKVKDEEESKKLVQQLSTEAVDDTEEARRELENLSLENSSFQ